MGIPMQFNSSLFSKWCLGKKEKKKRKEEEKREKKEERKRFWPVYHTIYIKKLEMDNTPKCKK